MLAIEKESKDGDVSSSDSNYFQSSLNSALRPDSINTCFQFSRRAPLKIAFSSGNSEV